mmetsp:Transcript_6922/g.18897  ORF Transcript_6922/g.18897 Transcript_6922/m.18897 type:complete len:205 (+) Transcript_6922:102-716(+)
MIRMIAVKSLAPDASSSQYDLSCACQSKSVGELTLFLARLATTSRAWTSMTTSAPRVLRWSEVSSPRTRSTMFMRSLVHFSSYLPTARVPSEMASVTCLVQNTAVTTRTTIPGQSSTHWSLGLAPYDLIPSPVMYAMLSNIAASTCSSHFSTAPLACCTEMISLRGTSSFSSEIMDRMSCSSCPSSPSENLSLAIPSKHFLRWG